MIKLIFQGVFRHFIWLYHDYKESQKEWYKTIDKLLK